MKNSYDDFAAISITEYLFIIILLLLHIASVKNIISTERPRTQYQININVCCCKIHKVHYNFYSTQNVNTHK